MKAKPILFSTPMIRAILDGRKKQTRRLVRHGVFPPYADGDVLWVREAWWNVCAADGATVTAPGSHPGRDAAFFVADHPEFPPCPHYRRRPSIHMPRWASRLTLRVADVVVERLQDISEDDAKAEGAEKLVMDDEHRFYASGKSGSHRCGFAGLWESINGRRKGASWDDNPWVVAITFDVIRANVDEITVASEVAA